MCHTVISDTASFMCRYLILQVLFWYLDGVVLDSISVPLVGDLLGHQLFEDEEQQLVVVSAEGQVTSERLHRNTVDLINIKIRKNRGVLSTDH